MNEGEKFDWLQQRLNVLETKQQYSSRKHAMCVLRSLTMGLSGEARELN